MKSYFVFAAKRAAQMLAVIFFGISVTFVIAHLSPVDPVQAVISRITARANFSPEAIIAMREALTEMFGVERPLLDQFISFWHRLLVGDFGPALIAFPTPAMDLVMRALPWTMGLLSVATIISWVVGTLLGALAGYFPQSRILRFTGIVTMGLQPIPYYIVAFVLLVVFGYLWPILPISGGFAMNVRQEWSLDFLSSVIRHATLPGLSIVLVGLGGWFLGMRALVSNVITEDYVTYAELGGVGKSRILSSYVVRNAAVPQLTALALTLGLVFSGAVITENVFTYPGLGSLLVDAVNAGDYTLVLAVGSVSITAVAVAIFVIEMLHPIIDPRVRLD